MPEPEMESTSSPPPGDRYLAAKRWATILRALVGLEGGAPTRSYLDVGCGFGGGLALVARAGLGLERVVGIDLDPAHLRAGRGSRDDFIAVCGDAVDLPFPDECFDIVTQSMLLSSITDRRKRTLAGREMLRVLRPGGWIVSLDLRYPRLPPRERVALGLEDLREIFPGLTITSTTHGLLPPLARFLAPFSDAWCDLLERIPALRVYRLAVLRRPG